MAKCLLVFVLLSGEQINLVGTQRLAMPTPVKNMSFSFKMSALEMPSKS